MVIAKPADGSSGWGGAVRGAIDLVNEHQAAAGLSPAVQLAPLPGLTDARYYFSFTSTIQDSVVTHGDQQYAIWTNDADAPIIAKRTLPQGPWATFDLSTITGNPLGAPTELDLHNNYSMAVDGLGFVHIAGNHHGDSMRYTRSTTAGSITAWTSGAGLSSPMTGLNENLVSYPRFVPLPDGRLLFFYRNGASAAGDWYVNRYDPATTTWTQLGKLFDGLSQAPTASAYTGKIYCDANGAVHIFFMWAPFETAEDLSYIRSTDAGQTWTTVTGAALTLPIVPGQAVAFPLVDGLSNACPAYADLAGHPHSANNQTDGNGNRQLTHFWHDGTQWRQEALTRFTESGSTSPGEPSTPMIFGDKQDRIYVAYTAPKDNRRGGYYLIACDTPFEDHRLLDLDFRDAHPTYDVADMRDNHRLTFLAGPASWDINARPEYWGDDHWYLWAGVCSVDLAQISKIRSGAVRLPTIRPLTSASAPRDATVSSATMVAIPGMGCIIPPPEFRNRKLFVRYALRASVSAAGTTMITQVTERQQGGSDRTLASLTINGTSSSTRSTQWLPLKNGSAIGGDSDLTLEASVTGGGTGKVIVASMTLGVLSGPGTGA